MKSTHASPESRFAAPRKAVDSDTVPSDKKHRAKWHWRLTPIKRTLIEIATQSH